MPDRRAVWNLLTRINQPDGFGIFTFKLDESSYTLPREVKQPQIQPVRERVFTVVINLLEDDTFDEHVTFGRTSSKARNASNGFILLGSSLLRS